MSKKPTGTKEWAEKNINLFTGRCANNCVYCYAGANAHRFGQSTEWKRKDDLLRFSFTKRKGLTMYPSTHDIRPEDIMDHIEFLHHFLTPGNEVLIVTKPWVKTMDMLTFALKKFKNQITFRFTVGSTNEDIIKLFEPNAPSYDERKLCILRAYLLGYKTSLSIEPMLDSHPEWVIEDLQRYINGDIWIGKMRHAKQRCMANGCTEEFYDKYVEPNIRWQKNDAYILDLVNTLQDNKQVKWKDSIIEVLDRSFHVIYTKNGVTYSLWKQFSSFQSCETWIKEKGVSSYEIGVPACKLPVES